MHEHTHCGGVLKFANADNTDDVVQCECSCHQQNAELETPCPKREDGQHCDCWYDGAACCACGAPAELVERKGGA